MDLAELKQVLVTQKGLAYLVLIGPCGIETYFTQQLAYHIIVLIGPCGIETEE